MFFFYVARKSSIIGKRAYSWHSWYLPYELRTQIRLITLWYSTYKLFKLFSRNFKNHVYMPMNDTTYCLKRYNGKLVLCVMLSKKSTFWLFHIHSACQNVLDTTPRYTHSLTCFKGQLCNVKAVENLLLSCLKTVLQKNSTLSLRGNFSNLGASISCIFL